MIKHLLTLIITILALGSCVSSPEDSKVETISAVESKKEKKTAVSQADSAQLKQIKEQSQKYAGNYRVYDDYGMSDEKYELGKNLSAVWSYKGENNKSGDWKYENDELSISINGNSGIIKEVYVKEANIWRNKTESHRYLKPL